MASATVLFGRRIRELRKSAGLSQEELGACIGIDQKHMSKIELGKSYPSLDRLIQISATLQVDLPSLFVFDHLQEDSGENVKKISELAAKMSERDQKIMYRIAKIFLES